MNAELFNDAFNSIERNIEFNEDWNNGTGYLDGAVHTVELPANLMAKSVTNDGRKIIFIGTNHGTIVVFERYTNTDNSEDITVVTNTPREHRADIKNGSIDDDEFCNIFFKDWDLIAAAETLNALRAR